MNPDATVVRAFLFWSATFDVVGGREELRDRFGPAPEPVEDLLRLVVGDAVHHKDPIDGQGIYDALLETVQRRYPSQPPLIRDP